MSCTMHFIPCTLRFTTYLPTGPGPDRGRGRQAPHASRFTVRKVRGDEISEKQKQAKELSNVPQISTTPGLDVFSFFSDLVYI